MSGPGPDVASLTDDDLRERLRTARREENQISYRRRMLHGRIDVVRTEILARSGAPRAGDRTADADLIDRLRTAFDHVGPPPLEDELSTLGPSPEHLTFPADDLELLPELTTLSDGELAGLTRSLIAVERETSDRRNALHREIDALRSEHLARLRTQYPHGLAEDDEDEDDS